MIFGEYLGEVVSNGEYEIRAQGTTVAGLTTAINALTMEEYYDSFLTIGDNSGVGSSNELIFYPYNSKYKTYMQNLVHSSGTGLLSVSTYYYGGVVYEITKTLSSGSVTRTVKNTQDGNLTVSAWTLYTRKQTLAIPGAGFNYKIVQYKNNNAVTLKASGNGDSTSYSSSTLDKVGSDDITGYTAVAITQFSCSKDGVCIRFAGSSPLGIGIVNTRNADVTVPVGGVLLSVLYIKL